MQTGFTGVENVGRAEKYVGSDHKEYVSTHNITL